MECRAAFSPALRLSSITPLAPCSPETDTDKPTSGCSGSSLAVMRLLQEAIRREEAAVAKAQRGVGRLKGEETENIDPLHRNRCVDDYGRISRELTSEESARKLTFEQGEGKEEARAAVTVLHSRRMFSVQVCDDLTE